MVCVGASVGPEAWMSTYRVMCPAAPHRSLAHTHSTALIIGPVTTDTHSCAAPREQPEHKQRLQGAGKASGENTNADEYI